MLLTSLDGEWIAIRRDRSVTVHPAAGGPAVATIALPSDDAELVFVGPPHVLAIVARDEATRVTLHAPPAFEAGARVELEHLLHVVTTTGARFVLLSHDGKHARVVRTAGPALAVQNLDGGTPIELIVALDRNQLLVGLYRKTEVWDVVSARPLRRATMPLPPLPRYFGNAHAHMWAARPGTDELYVYRLSDGRPFSHQIGATIERVIAHPASPNLVLVTGAGLVRLNCFAHSLALIPLPADATWSSTTAFAQLPAGDEVYLLGLPDGADAPWRVAITRPTS